MEEPTKQQQLQTTNVKLLTYNIFQLPSGVTANGNDYKEERMKEWIESPNGLGAFDVVRNSIL